MRLSFFAGRRWAVPFYFAVFSFAAPCAWAAQDVPAAPAAAKPSAVVHATWDDSYIYFAFQVDDDDVTGVNTRPLSHPEQDDSVGVYFETGTARPTTPDAHTHAMLVSVAGGFTLLDGDAATQKLVVAAKPDFSIKYGVTVQGTLNRSDDRDQGYTITLAVPLTLLQLDPKTLTPGTHLGFNAIVRSRTTGGFSSLAPGVKTEADVSSPAQWTQLTLLGSDGGASAVNASVGNTNGGLNVPKVVASGTPPLIDGAYHPLDWPQTSQMAFLSPAKPHEAAIILPEQPVDFAKQDATPPALDLSAPITGMQQLTMARYVPTYQADRRRPDMPTRGVYAPDGSIALLDQPATGIGPWFSADRLSYHRTELSEMRHAGIDVALVQIGGPDVADAAMDAKSVLVMVSALRDLIANGAPAPQLALFLDTSRLAADGSPTDLTTAAGRDRLYAAIRRWIRLVPPELRARVLVPQTGANAAPVAAAYPIFLAGPTGAVMGIAASDWTDALRTRFAAEFGAESGGTTLLFSGFGPDWAAGGTKMAAVLPFASGKGTGAISTFFIQTGAVVPGRKAGAAYQAAWEAAVAANPIWYVIDSWNGFTNGSEITPTRQFGPQYTDQTRIYALQTSGLKPMDVRYLNCDAPRRMSPGEVVATTVTLQNTGRTPLGGDDGVAITYRWRQNGQVVAESPLRLPLTHPLLPSRSGTITIGLTAGSFDVSSVLTPLPPGDYVVEIDLTTTTPGSAAPPVYLSESSGSPPLRLPVTVVAGLPDYVEFSGTTTPAVLRSGETIGDRVRLRWLGGTPLGLGDASLVYQIVSDDGKTIAKTASVPLPVPLQPGQWETIPIPMELSDATTPIPPANPNLLPGGAGSYRIRWLLTRPASVAAIPGEYDENVAVYASDDAALIQTPSAPPASFDVSARVPIDVRIVNKSSKTWAKDAYAVGYHWYEADGLESLWKPVRSTPIDRDVKAGEAATISVGVLTPEREGDYILAIDVLRQSDQTFLSTLPVSRSGDLGLIPIRVRGEGHLRYVDLSPYFDVAALASQAHPEMGAIDAAGDAFPAESFPPDHFGIVARFASDPEDTHSADRTAYPSGFYYYADPAARTIAFRYGPDADGAKNAVGCTAQTIDLPHGRYQALNVAATAIGENGKSLQVTLHYADGTTETVDHPLPDWNHPPGLTDAVAVTTSTKRSKTGDTLVPCSVWHVILPANAQRDLVGVTLPNDPAIKVFAITLEKS